MKQIVLGGPRLYVYINSYGNEAEKEHARECIRQYIANIRDIKKREEYRVEIESNRHGKDVLQLIDEECAKADSEPCAYANGKPTAYANGKPTAYANGKPTAYANGKS
jgi:SHS2 domain-containing protein